jgi:hypothetical protein
LSRDSQARVLKFPLLGLPWLWGRITSRANFRLQCNLKQSCNSRQELSKGMSHAACTRQNRVNSWLLVVEN